jgi:hypothetical protein
MKVEFAGPNDRIGKCRPAFEEISLKHQISQYYSLKSAREVLFGSAVQL